jgi:DNA polymerase-1
MSDIKKLFLLDAYAMLYRSYFAFINAPRRTSWGLNTSAPYGFTNALIDVLKTEKPTHIGVAFDPGGKTFRHQQYEAYKAQRQEMPEELRASIPYVKQIIEAFNIPILQVEGFEADDVIGTLAKQAVKQGFESYLLTPDKDYCQLVEPGIFIYRPRSFGPGYEIMDVESVKTKFSISEPSQVIDILGLWGDASDNIPGAPGIGEKRAKDLVAAYGSIENIYNHLDELKGKQKDNIIAFKDQILLSKYLATIHTNVPIEFHEESLRYDVASKQKLIDLFKHLEFRTFANRLFGEQTSVIATPTTKKAAPVQASLFDMIEEQPETVHAPEIAISTFETIYTKEHSYHLVDTLEKRLLLFDLLKQNSEFCFDTETTSLDVIDARLVGISFAIKNNEAWYVSVPEDKTEAQAIADLYKPLFEDMCIAKIGQNMKYDISVLANYGIEVQGQMFDTMIAHYLVQPDLRHGLDYLAELYLNYKMVSIDELIGKKGIHQKSFRSVPLEQAKEYSGEDADITFQLRDILQAELRKHKLTRLFTEVEMPLVKILSQIERTGVNLNVEALKQSSVELKTEVAAIEQAIYQKAGCEFNIASPKQLGEILFDRLKISDKAKKTKTKQYATGEEVLELLKGEHPIVDDILEYRSIKKLVSTYIDALPELINQATNHVHTSYNQAIVATGRLSSTNPNLQNIPVRSQKGKEIRRAFIPSASDRVFLSADYSQIELRVIAHFSGDEAFILAFKNNEDIHAATASKIFGIPLDEVTSEQRRQAKSANFAISYGSSAFGLGQNLNISRKDAQFLIDGYFATYPKVKEFMDKQIGIAREQGYVETMMGRRRYLQDINSNNATVRGFAERNAINAPIQGSAADIIKIAMIKICKEFSKKNLQSRMIMQVHDELNFDVLKTELDVVTELVRSGMQNAIHLKVPLLVDLGVGDNWLEAH